MDYEKEIKIGRYWSKKHKINFEFFDISRSDFYLKFYRTNLFVRQIEVMWSKSGTHNLVRKVFNKALNSLWRENLSAKNIHLNILPQKNNTKKIANTILKYRIAGRIKKKRISRRRIENYTSYLSGYNQWRRTIRFLGVFFKKKGKLHDKIITEFSKIRSKKFHYKRDSIMYRTNRLFTGLDLKYKANRDFKRKYAFFTPENFFSKKYYHLYWEKYLKSFWKSPNFLKRIHPKSRR